MEPFLFTLKSRKEIAEDTMAVFLDTSGTGFSFKAGQYINMSIIDPKEIDRRGISRSMSIASSPDNTNQIMLSMRIRPSAFKNNLFGLPVGSKLKALGPFGMFTLPADETKEIVFLAGGIGVTPMRSMIEWALSNNKNYKMTLFHSSRTIHQAAFFKEFISWSLKHKNFTFIPTFTDEQNPSLDYESGRINETMLRKYLKDINTPLYYIAGTTDMAIAIRDMLEGIGINPDNIHTEQFGGY